MHKYSTFGTQILPENFGQTTKENFTINENNYKMKKKKENLFSLLWHSLSLYAHALIGRISTMNLTCFTIILPADCCIYSNKMISLSFESYNSYYRDQVLAPHVKIRGRLQST